jgi:hypothetical protein
MSTNTAMNPTPPAKPWVVVSLIPCKNTYYPWHAEVHNHYFMPGQPGFNCYWNTALEDARFDLSQLEAVAP